MSDAPVRTSRQDLAPSMKALVMDMAKALVDHPDRVAVDAASEPESTVLILRVDPTDLGKVIGRQGRTARAMRTILGAASMKAQHRFALDIRQTNEEQAPQGT